MDAEYSLIKLNLLNNEAKNEKHYTTTLPTDENDKTNSFSSD